MWDYFNLGLTICGLIGLVLLFGLDRTVLRQIPFYQSINDNARESGTILGSYRIVFILISLVFFVLFITSDDLFLTLFGKIDLIPILRVLLLSIPFTILARLSLGVLQAYKRMKPSVIIESIFIPLANLIGMIFVLNFFLSSIRSISIIYLLVAIVGASVALLITFHFYRSRKFQVKPIVDYSLILQLSWPLFGATLLNRTNTYIDTIILGGLASSEQVGYYTVSFKIAITVAVSVMAINTVFAPFIAKSFAQRDKKRLTSQFKIVTRWGLVLTLPITIILIFTAPDILMILNPTYLRGVPILRILALSQFTFALVGPTALMLTMTHYMRLNLLDLFLTLILSLLLDFFLIPQYGAIGAAVASAISLLFINLLRLTQVYWLMGVHPFSRGYIKAIMAASVASFVTFGGVSLISDVQPIWRFLSISFLFGGIYILMLIILKGDDSDREILRNIFQSLSIR